MATLTQYEKNAYNIFLKVQGQRQGRPSTARKDFSTFEEDKALHLRRIGNLFNKFPHINKMQYFKAPYEVYPDTKYFGLDYYAGMQAVKAWNLYMKTLQQKNPDCEDQLEFIVNSLMTIAKTCSDNKINVDKYPHLKTSATYDWMKQLNRNEISVYALMEFECIFDIIMEVEEDERKFLLGDYGCSFHKYKDTYLNSTEAKYLVKNGINKIKETLSHPVTSHESALI